MAFAKPPNYRLRKSKGPNTSPQTTTTNFGPATYKPPKNAPGVTDLTSAVGYANAHGNANAGPSAPSYDPGDTQPQAPVAQATPPFPAATPPSPTDPGGPGAPGTPVVPPETFEGASDRTAARTGYGTSMADINSRILAAAMDYGGVDSVNEAGLDAQGNDIFNPVGVVGNPNSQIATIGRGLADNSTALSEDLNNRNSYFSGAHLDRQTRLDDQAGRDRLAAQTAFDRAYGALMSELARAQDTRRAGIAAGDLADITAASATTPQAEATPPPPAAGTTTPPAATTPPPAAGVPTNAPTVVKQTAQKTTGKALITKKAKKKPAKGAVKVVK